MDAVKLGAFDYLPKPLQPEILRHAIERALDYQRLLRSQRDLETVFQGAEALGWQALELVSSTPEAVILGELREQAGDQNDLKEVGRTFLEAAQNLLQVTNCSIFLYDAVRSQFSGLAALGPECGGQGRGHDRRRRDHGLRGHPPASFAGPRSEPGLAIFPHAPAHHLPDQQLHGHSPQGI